MDNYSIVNDDLKYVLEITDLKDKSYKNYIVKTIETTVHILNQLKKMKNQSNTIHRADRQIKKGVGYLRKLLKTKEIKYLIKSIDFLEYLLLEELITEPKYSQFKEIIKLLRFNSLKLNEDVEIKINNIILSFECLFFLGKNVNNGDILGFEPLIEFLNPPNENDILISSIYHLTAIQIEWETTNNIHGIGFDIDFNEKRYKPYFKKSEEIISSLFKKALRKKTNNKMINLLNYSTRYSYYIYKNEILGIIPSKPRGITGYSSISDFYSYCLLDNNGLKGYFLKQSLMQHEKDLF